MTFLARWAGATGEPCLDAEDSTDGSGVARSDEMLGPGLAGIGGAGRATGSTLKLRRVGGMLVRRGEGGALGRQGEGGTLVRGGRMTLDGGVGCS